MMPSSMGANGQVRSLSQSNNWGRYDEYAQYHKRALLDIGYQDIHEALNGEEALDKLQSGGFGLVLLVWNMPVMSGLEMLRIMRADPALQKIPVLMITAEAQMKNIMEAVQAGVSDYLIKPFSGQALQEKLEKMFEKLPKENA